MPAGSDVGSEANRIDFLSGLARNERLEEAIKTELVTATVESIRAGKLARCSPKDFTWSTLDSWSRSRRVVGKAEVTGVETDPRFVVTSLKAAEIGGKYLYEEVYCAHASKRIRATTSGRIKPQLRNNSLCLRGLASRPQALAYGRER